MTIENVFCTINKQYMNITEVAKHEEHNEVKQHLQCATEGCVARMCFVSTSLGKTDYFKAVRSKEHSPDCYLKQTKEATAAKVQTKEAIATSLSKKSIQRRMNNFHRKRMGQETVKKPVRKPKIKIIIPGTETAKRKGIIGTGDAIPFDKQKKIEPTSVPKVQQRELNQISEKDENEVRHFAASIGKIKRTKNGFEIDLFLLKSKAKLIITEAFIKSSRDNEIVTYLESLKKFIDSRTTASDDISIYVFAQFQKYQGNDTIIFAHDSEQLSVFVPDATRNPIGLDLFEVLYSHKNLK